MDYNDKTTVSIDFTVMTQQDESDEMISCYMPEIGQYFSARTHEDVQKKAKVFIKMWIKYYNEKNK